MPIPLIAAAAKFILPMATKMMGGLMSGGFGGMLSKLFNFGDMLGGLFGKSQSRTQAANEKMDRAQGPAQTAQQQAEAFQARVDRGLVNPLPVPAFNLF